MNCIEKAIRDLIKEMLDEDIEHLEDFNQSNLKDLCLFLDYDYFYGIEINNWLQMKQSLENFMKNKNLDQKLDFNLKRLEEKNLANMISAFIQIFSIFSIFQVKWEELVNLINYEQKQVLMEVLTPITHNLKQEIKKFKTSPSFVYESNNHNNIDLKIALKNLEKKDKIIEELQQQISRMEIQIIKKDNEIEKQQQQIKTDQIQMNQINGLKDSAIKQLDEVMSNQIQQKEINLLQNELYRKSSVLKSVQNELLQQTEELKEKEYSIQKFKRKSEFFDLKSKKFDKFVEEQNDIHQKVHDLETKEKILESKNKIISQQVNTYKSYYDKYIDEKKENQILQNEIEKLTNNQSQILSQFQHQKLTNLKTQSFNNMDKIEQNLFIEDITQENDRLQKKIRTLNSLQNQQLQNNKQRGSFSIVRDKQNYLKKTEIKENNENDQKEKEKFDRKISLDEQFNVNQMDVLYTICMNFSNQQQLMKQRRMLVPKKQNRKRNIFSKFTLNYILKQFQLQ